MSKIKQIVTVTGVVIAFMGTLCSTANAGVECVEKIKTIKGGK